MSQVAIVIPVYDHADALGRTLEALRQQTFKDIEIVIVDDASHDRPDKVVKRFTDLPIRFITWSENRGAPAARNEGARLTSAPYLVFLDADASLTPGAVARMATALGSRADVDFVYSDFYWGSKAFRGRTFDPAALRQGNYIHTSSMLRRSAFPGFDESIKRFQDWDLWLTMTEKGSKGLWIDEFLFTIEPRKTGGISEWMPKFMYKLPWNLIGWMPDGIKKYRSAEQVIRTKHKL